MTDNKGYFGINNKAVDLNEKEWGETCKKYIEHNMSDKKARVKKLVT